MGLSDVLARAAVTRCHVFLAEVLDGAGPRMAVERELARRGWVEALSPADADIFCVCGEVPDGQAEALDRLWDQLPGPRARVNVKRPADAGIRLDGCVAELLDTAAQRRQETHRALQPDDDDGGMGQGEHAGMGHDEGGHDGMEHAGMGHDEGGHDGMDMGEGDDGGMDHDGMDHSGMDHGGMDMPMPGGIPLAGEGTDRDGLNLDVLLVPLGPYLPLWPAGLVLHCELQGDVVFGATVDFEFGTPGTVSGPTSGPVSAVDERTSLVHHTDLAWRLLRLAGAASHAARTQRIRDAALAGALLDSATLESAALDQCRTELRAELGRLRKNWLLRRTLRGIGHVPADAGLPAGSELQGLAGTDVWTRLLGMFEAAANGAAPATESTTRPAGPPATEFFTAALPHLVRGQELSVLRLIVASFDLVPAAQKTAARPAQVPR